MTSYVLIKQLSKRLIIQWIGFLTSSCSSQSGTLRSWLQMEKEDEWLKITGALECFSAAQAVSQEVWERSTIIPSLFISSTTASKKHNQEPLDQKWEGSKAIRPTSGDGYIHINTLMQTTWGSPTWGYNHHAGL